MSTPVSRPSALGTAASFGFGDRIGLATPGHLESLRQHGHGILGIFAQQSIREMARTERTAPQVMECATDTLVDAGHDQPWGADADHLKTEADVDVTADAGFIFFTIDPSDFVDQKADNYSQAEVEDKFRGESWVDQYLGKTISVNDGPTISFDDATVKRAAVKYGKAIEHALSLADYIKQAAAKRNQAYEIEISVDETEQPTSLAEHYIIAEQLIAGGVKLVSLAPRFVGELEKGVDYIGDLDALEASLADHAAIARQLGPYKLSLHSGSDKVSMYSLFARATRGMFHVKTAGTSYLEALRVVARHEPELFRRIIDFGRDRYDTDRATYHVHATLASAPPASEVSDDHKLESLYLEHWNDVPQGKGFTQPGRQILHCTFGSVMTDAQLKPAVLQVLEENPGTHREILADHFGRHLQALRAGM